MALDAFGAIPAKEYVLPIDSSDKGRALGAYFQFRRVQMRVRNIRFKPVLQNHITRSIPFTKTEPDAYNELELKRQKLTPMTVRSHESVFA